MREPTIKYDVQEDDVRARIGYALEQCVEKAAVRPTGVYLADPAARIQAAQETVKIARNVLTEFERQLSNARSSNAGQA